MKQIKNMSGICKYCDGYCLRIESEKFKAVHNCKDFQPVYKEWYEDYRKEYKMNQEEIEKLKKEKCNKCKNKDTELCEILFSSIDGHAYCRSFEEGK